MEWLDIIGYFFLCFCMFNCGWNVARRQYHYAIIEAILAMINLALVFI